jgi:uncharacterized protein YndB with AHSA1/START domain
VSGFEDQAVCRAPAEEVFKLLYDPGRFPEWWAGMDRVERGGGGGVSRYMSEWPDFAYPMQIHTWSDGGGVAISCLLSDILHEWRIEPHPEGCAVRVRVELPERELERIDAQREEIGASLLRLVAAAERGAAAGR